jgi:hypothetical protein
MPATTCARAAAALGTLGLVAVLAGCGSTKTKTVTSTSTVTVTVSSTAEAESNTTLNLAQSAALATATPKYKPDLDVKPGDKLILRTVVKNAKAAKGTKLEVTMDSGPGTSLAIQAGNAGEKPTATSNLKGGTQKIVLAAPKYKCVIASTSICPVDKAIQTKKGFDVVLSTPKQDVPVVFTAEIGSGK